MSGFSLQLLIAQAGATENGSAIARALELIFLQGGYNATVVQIGTALLGVAAGAVGTFAVLRKRSLMGDALAHATLPGIALAFLIAPLVGLDPRSLPWLLVGAAVFSVLGVLCVQGITRASRLTEDSAMAIVLSSFFGLGFVLLSYIQTLPSGNQAGLRYLVLGQAAAMRSGDAIAMGVLALVVLTGAILLFKELRLICFDRAFAGALGWPTQRLDLVLMTMVVLVTVVGLQAVGIVLIVALLIVPAAAARLWTDRLLRVVILASLMGGASGYIGSIISALAPRIATGGSIVLVAGVFFLISLLIAPRRGILANLARHLSLRMRIARDHLLRSAYEWLDERGAPIESGSSVPRDDALSAHSSGFMRHLLIWRLARLGLIRVDSQDLVLTEPGAELSRRITRGHRLWEQYLLSHADVAPTHVHSPADLVEHALSPQLIDDLERALAARGRHAPEAEASAGQEVLA